MRKIAITSALLFTAISTAAFAADLPVTKGPPAYAPPPPAFSWTGFYIGGNIGYTWGHDHVLDLDDYNAPTGTNDIIFNPHGIAGGAQIGYNYQFTPYFLAGIELEGGYLGLRGSQQYGPYIGDPTRIGDSVAGLSGGAYGAFTGRIGVTFDRVLVYAKGGGFISGVHVSYVDPNPTGDVLIGGTNATVNRFGFTIGGGVEYAITNNWTIKGEYAYYNIGSHTLFAVDPAGIVWRFQHQNLYANEVKVGFNYKFDWFAPPAPVVAKY